MDSSSLTCGRSIVRRYRRAIQSDRENQLMRVETASHAVGLFDPALADETGTQLVRRVLDQARHEPRWTSQASLPDAIRNRLVNEHRIAPLAHRLAPDTEGHSIDRKLMLTQLHLSTIAREVVGVLDAEGIDVRILKGLATSELDYKIPSLRHTGDVDALISRKSIDRAARALLTAGYTAATPADEAADRLVNGSNLKGVVLNHESGTEVDLHYRLSRFAPHDETDALLAEPCPIRFGLLALPAEARLVHAASHSVLSPNPGRRLSSVADIVAIIDNTGVDWGKARRLADVLGLTGAVGAALRAEALILNRQPHPGLEWPSPTRGHRMLIESSRPLEPLQHALAMSALPADVSRSAYLSRRISPGARARSLLRRPR